VRFLFPQKIPCINGDMRWFWERSQTVLPKWQPWSRTLSAAFFDHHRKWADLHCSENLGLVCANSSDAETLSSLQQMNFYTDSKRLPWQNVSCRSYEQHYIEPNCTCHISFFVSDWHNTFYIFLLFCQYFFRKINENMSIIPS